MRVVRNVGACRRKRIHRYRGTAGHGRTTAGTALFNRYGVSTSLCLRAEIQGRAVTGQGGHFGGSVEQGVNHAVLTAIDADRRSRRAVAVGTATRHVELGQVGRIVFHRYGEAGRYAFVAVLHIDGNRSGLQVVINGRGVEVGAIVGVGVTATRSAIGRNLVLAVERSRTMRVVRDVGTSRRKRVHRYRGTAGHCSGTCGSRHIGAYRVGACRRLGSEIQGRTVTSQGGHFGRTVEQGVAYTVCTAVQTDRGGRCAIAVGTAARHIERSRYHRVVGNCHSVAGRNAFVAVFYINGSRSRLQATVRGRGTEVRTIVGVGVTATRTTRGRNFVLAVEGGGTIGVVRNVGAGRRKRVHRSRQRGRIRNTTVSTGISYLVGSSRNSAGIGNRCRAVVFIVRQGTGLAQHGRGQIDCSRRTYRSGLGRYGQCRFVVYLHLGHGLGTFAIRRSRHHLAYIPSVITSDRGRLRRGNLRARAGRRFVPQQAATVRSFGPISESGIAHASLLRIGMRAVRYHRSGGRGDHIDGGHIRG